MRVWSVAFVLAAMFGALQAFAQQDQSLVVIPPTPPAVPSAPTPPPQPAAPTPPPPPGLTTATPPTDTTSPAGPQPVTPDLAPTPANTWVPGKGAVLGVLDKVDGGTSQLSLPVGGQAATGDLTVSVQACVTRPPGQIPDAAVFLTVQPTADASASPLFRGWMIRSAPGAAIVGNAAETFRIIGCS